jgi:hypothetical protein
MANVLIFLVIVGAFCWPAQKQEPIHVRVFLIFFYGALALPALRMSGIWFRLEPGLRLAAFTDPWPDGAKDGQTAQKPIDEQGPSPII